MIVSSLAEEGAEQTVAALALGAADTLPKPGTGRFNGKFSEILLGKLKALGYATGDAALAPALCAARRPHGGCCARCRRDPIERARDRRLDRRHPRARRPVPGAAARGSAFRSSSPSICRRRSCRCSPASSARSRSRERGRRRGRHAAACPTSILIAPGDAHLTLDPMRDGAVVRLTPWRAAQRLHAVGRPDARLGRRHLRRRRARRRADRHGPRRRRRRDAAGRVRRLGPRPGRGQLRRLGHAARGARSRPRLRGLAARQDRPADRRADRGAAACR